MPSHFVQPCADFLAQHHGLLGVGEPTIGFTGLKDDEYVRLSDHATGNRAEDSAGHSLLAVGLLAGFSIPSREKTWRYAQCIKAASLRPLFTSHKSLVSDTRRRSPAKVLHGLAGPPQGIQAPSS